eukprot:5854127-Amphidinium_carterae.1
MAPKKQKAYLLTEDAEQKQANLFLESEEAVRKAKKRQIELALQNYPNKCVDALHARLRTLD